MCVCVRASCHAIDYTVPILVLIAETIWLLERGQTDRQTDEVADATERPISGTDGNRGVGITCSPDVDHNTHSAATAGVGYGH